MSKRQPLKTLKTKTDEDHKAHEENLHRGSFVSFVRLRAFVMSISLAGTAGAVVALLDGDLHVLDGEGLAVGGAGTQDVLARLRE